MKIQVHFSNMMKTVVIHLKNKLNTVISERNIFTPPPMNRNQLLELGSKSPSNICDINLPSHEKQRRNINTIRKKMQNPKYKNESFIVKGERRKKFQDLFKKLNSSSIEKINVAKNSLKKAINSRSLQKAKDSQGNFNLTLNQCKKRKKRSRNHQCKRIFSHVDKALALEISSNMNLRQETSRDNSITSKEKLKMFSISPIKLK